MRILRAETITNLVKFIEENINEEMVNDKKSFFD